jgi:hypothetical protein
MQSQEESPIRHAKLLIPQEAYQLAESHRLGKPTAYYVNQRTGNRKKSAFLVASIALAVDVLVFWAILQSNDLTQIIILCLCLCLPILALVYFASAIVLKEIREASTVAYFCQDGFIYKDGKRLIVLRWEEIERANVEAYWHRRCEVVLGNGERIVLVNAVGGDLREQIRRRLLRARKRHQHGEAAYYRE